MMSDILYIVLHIPLVDKSLQVNLFRMNNFPLVHPILKKPFRLMACQVSNGQFCHINSPLYTVDTLCSCSYVLFPQNKYRINKFCILSVINQTQDEAININDHFWSISTLQTLFPIRYNLPTQWL